MKKFVYANYINIGLCALFSFLSFPLGLDVSLISLPLALGYTGLLVWYSIFLVIKPKSIAHFSGYRRVLEYEPFALLLAFVFQRAGKRGTPYFFDLILVLLWISALVFVFVLRSMISQKKYDRLCPEFAEQKKTFVVNKEKGIKRVFLEVFEWLDAIVWAVFSIVLINIFLFQFYEIPSESMVPEFLVKDRVVVFKTLAGPKFPLSDIGLPYIQKYDRGDIVVFSNPHYKDDRKSRVKSFFSQIIYMCTLTTVNTNVDENGNPKYDPLVKRVCGLPGEQLIMMDGQLYSRTPSDPVFKAVENDNKWAEWDITKDKSLYSLKNKSLKIEKLPLTGIYRNQIKEFSSSGFISFEDALKAEKMLADDTLEMEEERRNLDLVSASLECKSIAEKFKNYARGKKIKEDQVSDFFDSSYLEYGSLLNLSSSYFANLVSKDGGSQWFTDYMTSWIKNFESLSFYEEDGSVTGEKLVGGDLYTDANFRLNVMTKLLFGRMILRQAELSSSDLDSASWNNDSVLRESYEKARKLRIYIALMDQRNFPLFPSNDENGNAVYIPENSYFMMGDNRYNSADMRHSGAQTYEELKVVPLYAEDPYSALYHSSLEGQYVSRSKILGKASYRFWPLSRAGIPGKSYRK